jgi:hypothetical protein
VLCSRWREVKSGSSEILGGLCCYA